MAMAEYSNPSNEAGVTGRGEHREPRAAGGDGVRHDAAPAVQLIELLTQVQGAALAVGGGVGAL